MQQLIRQLRVNSNPTTTFGRMQSDIISREQARQQRLANDIMNQTLQSIGAGRSLGGRRGGRGRGRGRGRNFNLERINNNVQLARNSINRR